MYIQLCLHVTSALSHIRIAYDSFTCAIFLTGRLCDFCGGRLQDTIVHFSETYRSDSVGLLAMHHAKKADMAIVIGTSMNVQTAASYPDKCLKKPDGQMVIVNLQKTPYDMLCQVGIIPLEYMIFRF